MDVLIKEKGFGSSCRGDSSEKRQEWGVKMLRERRSLCEQWVAFRKCHAVKCHTSLLVHFLLSALSRLFVPGWAKGSQRLDYSPSFLKQTPIVVREESNETGQSGIRWMSISVGKKTICYLSFHKSVGLKNFAGRGSEVESNDDKGNKLRRIMWM